MNNASVNTGDLRRRSTPGPADDRARRDGGSGLDPILSKDRSPTGAVWSQTRPSSRTFAKRRCCTTSGELPEARQTGTSRQSRGRRLLDERMHIPNGYAAPIRLEASAVSHASPRRRAGRHWAQPRGPKSSRGRAPERQNHGPL
jgi:hypothetical protein